MIRELAEVTAVDSDWVEVATKLKSGCSGCEHQNHCGAGLLSKALPQRNGRLQFAMKHNFQVGEQVELLMPEQSMVRFSLMLYGIPMLALMISAMIGHWFWPNQEGLVIGFTVVTTAVSLILLKRYLHGRDGQIRRALHLQTRTNSDIDCRNV